MRAGLKFREQLTGLLYVVQQELDQLIAAITQGFYRQHNAEGRHTAITATDLVVTAFRFPTAQSNVRGHIRIIDDKAQGRPCIDFGDTTFTSPGYGASGSDDGRVKGRISCDLTTTGSTLGLHTSSAYPSGVNNTGFKLNPQGYVNLDNQPRCRVYHDTTQALTTDTWTTVLFNSEDHDTGAMHSTSSNTSRLTVPTGGAGIYLCGASIHFNANATGQRFTRWIVNGSPITGADGGASTANLDATYGRLLPATTLLNLAAADYVEIQAYQDSGGNLNIGHATSTNSRNTAYAIKLA